MKKLSQLLIVLTSLSSFSVFGSAVEVPGTALKGVDIKSFYLDNNEITFKEVNDAGDVIFEIDEDCDYNAFTESGGTITLKKKNDGGYYLNIQLQTTHTDLEEGAFAIEALASEGVKNPALAYCKSAYPKVVASNFEVLDKKVGVCETRVMFFMKKD